jgi:hypothetical protein
MEIVNKILEMMSEWPPFGQAIFLLIILGGAAGLVTTLITVPLRYLAIIFRGWPDEYEDDDDDEDDNNY